MQAQDSFALTRPDDYVFQLVIAGSQRLRRNQLCFAARTSGLFRSCDGGQSWENAYADLKVSERLPTTSVAAAPNFEHEPTIFAGLNGAILCSYDGGAKWQRGHLPTPPPAISALAISPNYAEDGTIFAGTNEDGVLVSQDRGRNWITWNFGLLDLNILCLGISPDFATDETILAGTESGLFRSTNGGRAWKEISLSLGYDAVLSLAFSFNFAQDRTLFAGTENKGLLISSDGGKSWSILAQTLSSEPINQILTSRIASSLEIFILRGSILLVSKDSGKTWRPWKAKRLKDCNITAFLELDSQEEGFLIGFEDGNILRV